MKQNPSAYKDNSYAGYTTLSYYEATRYGFLCEELNFARSFHINVNVNRNSFSDSTCQTTYICLRVSYIVIITCHNSCSWYHDYS
jgi:hypothetical protein